MDRYRVVLTRDGRRFGILDRDSYDYCGLPDENGRPKPLEWSQKEDAERWLQLCYRRWRAWEGEPKRRSLVPLRWRPHPPAVSPWDRSGQGADR